MYALMDDGFYDHRKVMWLLDQPDGLAAIGLWTLVLGWATRQANGSSQQDGAIPRTLVTRLAGPDGPKLAELLATVPPGCTHGLWDCTLDTWLIHDFAYWQQLEQRRAKSRTARRAAGIRWGTADADADASADADGHANADADAMPTKTKTKTKPSQELTPSIAGAFDAFWGVYPRKTGKRKAQEEFTQALRRVDFSVILAGAVRYRDDPNRVDRYTKHPSTWLHQDCWGDDPLPARGGGRGQGTNQRVMGALELAARYDQQERSRQ